MSSRTQSRAFCGNGREGSALLPGVRFAPAPRKPLRSLPLAHPEPAAAGDESLFGFAWPCSAVVLLF
jgi:hypothetical protein